MKITKKLYLILILSFLLIATQISCDFKEQPIEPSTGEVPTKKIEVEQIEPLIVSQFQFPLKGDWAPLTNDFNVWSESYCGYHLGQDILREPGTPVYPTAKGKVKFAQYLPDLKLKGGYVVIIEHTFLSGDQKEELVTSVYYHMRKPKDNEILRPGDTVLPDKPIGYISEKPEDHMSIPHLHFGIRKGEYSPGTDTRTNVWFYPGYTTIYLSVEAKEANQPENNPNNLIHKQIVSEWVKPSDFIEANYKSDEEYKSQEEAVAEEEAEEMVEEVTGEPEEAPEEEEIIVEEEVEEEEEEIVEEKEVIEPLLSIETTSLSSGTVGVSYNLSLLALGSKAPYSWSIVSGNIPSGLNLNTSGIISGTPTTAGTYNFTVQVRDSSSSQQTDLKELSINIADGTATDTTAPTVNSLSVTPSSVTLGSSFTIYYSVSDTGGSGLNRVELWRANDSGNTPVGWAEVKRTLASGNSYSSSFSDTPSSVGTYWYGIHVVNNTGNWTPESSPVKVTVTTSTLYISLVAAPSSGTAPLSVNLTATVSGTATGTINYTFYSNRSDYGTNITSGWVAKFDGVTDNPKTAVCNYSSPGTYTAKVIVERGSAPPAEARVTIMVSTAYDKEVTVANTSGMGINLRSGPGLAYNKITSLPEGTKMYIIDGPVQADGYTWWQITGAPGTGWSAVGEWLTPAPQVNKKVTVKYTGGIGLRLRSTASLSATILTTLPEGTQMDIFSGPIQADGYTWWALQGYVGGTLYTGWSVVGNWLVPNPRY